MGGERQRLRCHAKSEVIDGIYSQLLYIAGFTDSVQVLPCDKEKGALTFKWELGSTIQVDFYPIKNEKGYFGHYDLYIDGVYTKRSRDIFHTLLSVLKDEGENVVPWASGSVSDLYAFKRYTYHYYDGERNQDESITTLFLNGEISATLLEAVINLHFKWDYISELIYDTNQEGEKEFRCEFTVGISNADPDDTSKEYRKWYLQSVCGIETVIGKQDWEVHITPSHYYIVVNGEKVLDTPSAEIISNYLHRLAFWQRSKYNFGVLLADNDLPYTPVEPIDPVHHSYGVDSDGNFVRMDKDPAPSGNEDSKESQTSFFSSDATKSQPEPDTSWYNETLHQKIAALLVE